MHSTPAESKPAPGPTNVIPPIGKRNAEQELKDGVAAYADADYTAANKYLQNAVNLGLAKRDDRIQANKHLAFIACATGQQAPCRYYFRKVLVINPQFELNDTEAGHPLWGPIFKEVKQQSAGKK